MLVETTEGLRPTRTHCLDTQDPKAAVAFLKKAGLTVGCCVAFAANPETKEVVEVIKKGYFNQKDVKPLLAAGFTELMYSWAFAGKNFRFDSGETVKVSRTVDLLKEADVLPWKGLL